MAAAKQKSLDDRIKAMTAPMLQRKLYIVVWKGKPGVDIRPKLPDHLQFMIDLEAEGMLFASGPLGQGVPGDGLSVLRAADIAEANAIALRDPFVIAGMRDFEVREWTLMEGSATVTVRYSNRSVDVG